MVKTKKPIKEVMASRNFFNFAFSTLAFLLVLLIDPDSNYALELPFGATTVVWMVGVLKSSIGITMLHYARKAMFDYIDMGELYRVIMEAPVEQRAIGAGLFTIGVGLFVNAFALIISKAF